MSNYNVGDLVAEFLQAAGVDTVFGVVSVHNIPMMDGLGRRNAIRVVGSRGEMGAGHMADAYSRARKSLGCFITSTGPGAANAPGALVEARFAASPVLHLTGQTATANLDKEQGAVHDVMDQLGMLKSTSKSAYRIRAPEMALGVLMKAAREALTPPMGPVSIEIPIDVQRAKIKRPAMLDNLVIAPPAGDAGNAGSLDALADMASDAKRPMLWCGTGARYAGAAVQRLVDMGFGVVTSVNGRAVIPETHPMTLGAFQATAEVEKFYETVDFMLIAGGRVRGHETKDLGLKLPTRRAQIDVDPSAYGRTYAVEHFHIGDAEAALNALADRLENRVQVADDWASDLAACREETETNYRKHLGPYLNFPEIFREAMPDDCYWVRDVTMSNTTWGNRLLKLDKPEQNIYPVGAAIGPGFQFGIGAAFGAGGAKTVAITGDGGFYLNMTELWTATQEKPDVAIVIFNDGGYGVIKDIQDTLYGGRHYFADPIGPDLKGLAALADLPYFRVESEAEMGPQLKAAIDHDGPTLLEVDMTKIGKIPRYFQPPPYAAKD